MQDPTIRDATLDDLATIVDFNARLADESEDIQLDREVVTDGVAALLKDRSKGRYFMAERPGTDGEPEIVGQLMVTYEWSDWRNGLFLWIQSVYVAAEHRRSGIFRALYRHVEELSRSPGHCGLRLYVHDHNDGAKATYGRLGMVPPGYSVLETPDLLRD